jgi:hypothetical protein
MESSGFPHLQFQPAPPIDHSVVPSAFRQLFTGCLGTRSNVFLFKGRVFPTITEGFVRECGIVGNSYPGAKFHRLLHSQEVLLWR